MFYKILEIDTMKIIDIINEITYVKYQKRNNIVIICNEADNPNGILSSDTSDIYHVEGFDEFPSGDYKTVRLIEIYKDEYNELKLAIDQNKEVIEDYVEIVEEELPVEEEIPIEEDIEEEKDSVIDESTLQFVKDLKIDELKKNCQLHITKGFDVTLKDGQSYHFSLTLQDQINLNVMYNRILENQALIPYHADGELFKFYELEDAKTIVNAANHFKDTQLSYFNSLKNYVLSLESIEDINKVTYGFELCHGFVSEVFSYIESMNEHFD